MTAPAERPPKNFAQQVLGQWPLAAVLLGSFAGLIVAASSHWRAGTTLIGLSITMGGLFRLLPNRRVGLLAVRNKVVDTIVLLTDRHRHHRAGLVGAGAARN